MEKFLKKLETLGFSVCTLVTSGKRPQNMIFATNTKTNITYQYSSSNKNKAITMIILSLPTEIREVVLHNEKIDW